MEIQPSIRELIDPWTRVGFVKEKRITLFGHLQDGIKIVFVEGGAIKSRFLNKSKEYGPSVLYKKVWYSVDISMIELNDTDYWDQLVQ